MTIKSSLTLASTLTLVALLSGCATSGYKQAQKAQDRVEKTRRELLYAKHQIAVMVQTLNALTTADGNGISKAYREFVKEIGRTETQAARVRRRADTMERDGDAYFASWELDQETLRNPELQNRSEMRRAELVRQTRQAAVSMQAAKVAFNPLMTDLDDIEAYLGNELTPASVASISDMIRRANLDAKAVLAKIDRIDADLQRVSDRLAAPLAVSP